MNKGEVVYVGKSTSLEVRIQTHRANKCFDEVLYIPVDDNNDLDMVESAFIRLMNPKYNGNERGTPVKGHHAYSLHRFGAHDLDEVLTLLEEEGSGTNSGFRKSQCIK
jgi:hypothetical protein